MEAEATACMFCLTAPRLLMLVVLCTCMAPVPRGSLAFLAAWACRVPLAGPVSKSFLELPLLHKHGGHCSPLLLVSLPETGPQASRGAGLRNLAWLPVHGGYCSSCLRDPLPVLGPKQPFQTGFMAFAGRPLVFLASEVPRRSERDLAKFRRRRPNNLSGDVMSLDNLTQVCGSCSCT